MRWPFSGKSRRKTTVSLHSLVIASAAFTGIGLLLLTLRSLDDPLFSTSHLVSDDVSSVVEDEKVVVNKKSKGCATVEEMGDQFRGGGFFDVRDLIRRHFEHNGAARVRSLPPEEFCRQNYVIAKASEAGFGNEMYKILTAAALSVMLNRSLIIGQTRGKYPFGEYISYADTAFALSEVKHLWRQNGCLTTYGKHLVIRIDDFQRPRKTNVLCSNWREWEEPIIW
nr:hypothetical protein CTI12_AA375300 [Tanacetum cinerariifolium]